MRKLSAFAVAALLFASPARAEAGTGNEAVSRRLLLSGLSLPVHLPDDAAGQLETIVEEVVPRNEKNAPPVDIVAEALAGRKLQGSDAFLGD
eukprot:CAMPEP_0197492412 /NCGR_PEP_ID=MMETSP1311-20131121/8715_1 /TAXON_ID=464262 /ORGANISM="Genus nov. species nov., Strain RCC856" /LENGTH=91 /DNA_ID=CAMNT_0043037295 /DNA_START=150 /DNA_END=422 /DNA_ORIENTATION=-